ncbi:SPW repeat protein [Microvirga sp. 3-52]|nr:SPW repeat protein [Microvirga sp. 3-52]
MPSPAGTGGTGSPTRKRACTFVTEVGSFPTVSRGVTRVSRAIIHGMDEARRERRLPHGAASARGHRPHGFLPGATRGGKRMNVNPRTRGGKGIDADRASGKWTIVETLGGAMAAMLVASPWMYRYSDHAVAMWTSVVIGVLLGAVILTRSASAGDWPRLASLALGLCALLTPWLLGFSDVRNAAGLQVTAGIVVIMLNVIGLWVHHEEHPGFHGRRPWA